MLQNTDLYLFWLPVSPMKFETTRIQFLKSDVFAAVVVTG